MPSRENLKTVLELVLAWIVVFGVALAIPDEDLPMYYKLVIGLVSAIILAIFGVYYFSLKPDEDLTFYSPIHAMIVRMNNNKLFDGTSGLTVGKWIGVRIWGIDYEKVSEAFIQHSVKFKKEDLLIWEGIEKEIKSVDLNSGYGFYLTKERLEWFEDLEGRFNR